MNIDQIRKDCLNPKPKRTPLALENVTFADDFANADLDFDDFEDPKEKSFDDGDNPEETCFEYETMGYTQDDVDEEFELLGTYL